MFGLFSLRGGRSVATRPVKLPAAIRVVPFIVFIIASLWLSCTPLNSVAAAGHVFPVLSGLSESLGAGFEAVAVDQESVQPEQDVFSAGSVFEPTGQAPAKPESLATRLFAFAGRELWESLSGRLTDWVKEPARNSNEAPTKAQVHQDRPQGRDQAMQGGQSTQPGSDVTQEFNPKDTRLWEPLISKLVTDGMDETRVRKAFDELGVRYTSLPMGRKILELYGLRYGGGLQAGNVDGEEEVPVESAFTPVPTSLSLAGCRKLIKTNDKLFKGVQKRYGVPAQTIVALLLVETNLGNNLGSDPAFRNLASMALSTTPEHVAQHLKKLKLGKDKQDFIQASLDDKSAWAYRELKALISYADEMGFELMKIPGSMYGAVGICQFMPSNIKPYGIDGDGDGKVNLFKLTDAVHSVANYLRQHGWKAGMEPFQQLIVLRAYNQDNIYAYTVQAVSGRLALGDEFNKSPAIMAANPLNLVRGVVVPGYQKRSKVTNPIKPMQSYNDILGINPSPKPKSSLNFDK